MKKNKVGRFYYCVSSLLMLQNNKKMSYGGRSLLIDQQIGMNGIEQNRTG